MDGGGTKLQQCLHVSKRVYQIWIVQKFWGLWWWWLWGGGLVMDHPVYDQRIYGIMYSACISLKFDTHVFGLTIINFQPLSFFTPFGKTQFENSDIA